MKIPVHPVQMAVCQVFVVVAILYAVLPGFVMLPLVVRPIWAKRKGKDKKRN